MQHCLAEGGAERERDLGAAGGGDGRAGPARAAAASDDHPAGLQHQAQAGETRPHQHQGHTAECTLISTAGRCICQ